MQQPLLMGWQYLRSGENKTTTAGLLPCCPFKLLLSCMWALGCLMGELFLAKHDIHDAGRLVTMKYQCKKWTALDSSQATTVCRAKAAALADQLQVVYLRDKKASETVKAAILEALGLLLEAAPQVIPATSFGTCPSISLTGMCTALVHVFGPCRDVSPLSLIKFGFLRFAWVQNSFGKGSFRPSWLLEECRSVLERIAKSGKPQAGLAAGALAGLSAAFTACTVVSAVSLFYTENHMLAT